MSLSQPLFSLIFHQFSNTIQYYSVIICPFVMLPYSHHWWFPQQWNTAISRARMTHSTREHRRRESIKGVTYCCSNISNSIGCIKWMHVWHLNSKFKSSHFKNANNCWITNIYSYLETSGGQSSYPYLNVVHFFSTRVD